MENKNVPHRLTRSLSRLGKSEIELDDNKTVRVLGERLNDVSLDQKTVASQPISVSRKSENKKVTRRLTRSNSRVSKTAIKLERDKAVDELGARLNDVSLDQETLKSQATVVGRENEMMQLRNFLMDKFDNCKSANLYMSGSPGTGKTLTVTEVVKQLRLKNICKSYFINCMELHNANVVFEEIFTLLTGQRVRDTDKAADKIEKYFKTRSSDKKPIVLVLDEIDELIKQNDRILYRIYAWCLLCSRLVTIGIANSLDLTERLLPDLLLQSYRPHHIQMRKYSEDELSAIVKSLYPTSDAIVVKLCAKKVAAKSGDARAVIDLMKRSEELNNLEKLSETRSMGPPCTTPLQLARSHSRLLQMSSPAMSPSIKHVQRAIRDAERGSDPLKNMTRTSLPLHQKFVLCAGLIALRRKLRQATTLGSLWEQYALVCRSQDMDPLNMASFIDCASHLKEQGLVHINSHREPRQRVFTINLDEQGVQKALDDEALLSSVMNKFLNG